MLKFNKAILFAVAGLGLVGAANAQVINCTGTPVLTGAAPFLSVEGTTEAIPAVTINGTTAIGAAGAFLGTATACAGSLTSGQIALTSNVPFTNASSTANTPNMDVVVQVNVYNGTGAGITVGAVTIPTLSAGTIIATGISQAGNTVTAQFNSNLGLNVLGIVFNGLRVNANANPSNSVVTVIPTAVAGGGILFPGGGAGTAPTAITAGTVLSTLALPALTSALNQSLCTVAATSLPAVTSLAIQENFNAGFKSAAQYSSTSLGALAATGVAGAATAGPIPATQGTRFAVTFNNLNAGVNYYVPGTITSGLLVLTNFPAAVGTTASATVTVSTSTTTTVSGQVLLTPTNGSVTTWYGVTASDLTATEAATITLSEQVPSRTAVNTTSTSAPTASVSLVGAATGYAQFATLPASTISAPAVVGSNGVLTACSTTLLFPYVVNGSGFDTGVAISNTSTGITGVGATTGACNVTFFGSGAPVAPANVFNTGNIAAGTNQSFLLSDKAPGLNGYAVAVCNFQQAHGYAFITANAGTPNAYAANYLAIVSALNGTINATQVQ